MVLAEGLSCAKEWNLTTRSKTDAPESSAPFNANVSHPMTDARSLLAIAVLSAAAATAHAASFDCTKALSRNEQLICSNPLLSELDDQMGTSYEIALSQSPDPDALKREQRKWLVKRNGCAEVECLRVAYSTRLAELSHTPTAPTDSEEEGHWVQYHCSTAKGTFAFIPVPLIQLKDVRLDSYGPQRRLLTSQRKHDLRCSLNGFEVRAQVEAFEPSSGAGFCAAANLYRLESLTINGRKILSPNLLNHECFASIVFLELKVVTGHLRLRMCETLPRRTPPQTDMDELSTGEVRCHTKVVSD